MTSAQAPIPSLRAGSSHRIRDIAEQAGLSETTVDRVVHARAGVSARAIRQVEEAIRDLDRQATQSRLGARTLLIDLVMSAPKHVSGVVREALEAHLAELHLATVRTRFHLRENATTTELAGILDGIGRRGRPSHGVLLTGPDAPEIADAVGRLVERRVPVITLGSDIRGCGRTAYVGPDEVSAGASAAYLLAGWLEATPGAVLVATDRDPASAERERLAAFWETLAHLDPAREVVEISGIETPKAAGSNVAGSDAATDGPDADAGEPDASPSASVADLLATRTDVGGVYATAGGHRKILAALAAAGVAPRAFLAHGLDPETEDLLRSGALSAVLHHDVEADVRHGLTELFRWHSLLPGTATTWAAPVLVVTRYNIPPRLRSGT